MIAILFAFLGLLGISFLLATGHPGFAEKVTNFVFILLVTGVILKIRNNVAKES